VERAATQKGERDPPPRDRRLFHAPGTSPPLLPPLSLFSNLLFFFLFLLSDSQVGTHVWIGGDSHIICYNLKSGDMFTVNNAHARPVNDIALEGEYVWTSSNDRTVKVLLTFPQFFVQIKPIYINSFARNKPGVATRHDAERHCAHQGDRFGQQRALHDAVCSRPSERMMRQQADDSEAVFSFSCV
jgi:hypothetical protein